MEVSPFLPVETFSSLGPLLPARFPTPTTSSFPHKRKRGQRKFIQCMHDYQLQNNSPHQILPLAVNTLSVMAQTTTNGK